MCYNAEISCAFFVVGAAVVAYICTAAPRLRATNIQWVVLFYTLMELLQTVQYWTVNECDKPVNRYLTEVAYVFVILQPLMWNVYFYQISRERERSTFFTAIAMSLCWMGVNLISRALYDPANQPADQRAQRVCQQPRVHSQAALPPLLGMDVLQPSRLQCQLPDVSDAVARSGAHDVPLQDQLGHLGPGPAFPAADPLLAPASFNVVELSGETTVRSKAAGFPIIQLGTRMSERTFSPLS
ncbi:hypothetical protein EMCRGX_G013034 [Ephydatia muelleri]